MTNYVGHFHAALTVLAGSGHIKQRLIKAYENSLAAINEDELPIASKQLFADVRRQIHSVTPFNGEGPTRASVRKMSAEEASECASSIVALFSEAIRMQGHTQVIPAFSETDEVRVPPFLLKPV